MIFPSAAEERTVFHLLDINELYKILIAILMLCWQLPAQALTIEITEGVEGALPIAVVPFGWQGTGAAPTPALSDIVDADLQRSGRFKTLPLGDMLARPSDQSEVDFRDWRVLGMDYLVIGQVSPNGPGGYLVRFQLFDVFRGEQLAGFQVPATERNLRATGHQISDIVYEKLLGERGAFATRIAYVTSVAKGDQRQVELRIADADGHAPQTIVRSEEPLMSPAWSPDGKRLAMVHLDRGNYRIAVMDLKSKEMLIVSAGQQDESPSFAPNSDTLIYATRTGRDGVLESVTADGLIRQKLAPRVGGDVREPVWSPFPRF